MHSFPVDIVTFETHQCPAIMHVPLALHPPQSLLATPNSNEPQCRRPHPKQHWMGRDAYSHESNDEPRRIISEVRSKRLHQMDDEHRCLPTTLRPQPSRSTASNKGSTCTTFFVVALAMRTRSSPFHSSSVSASAPKGNLQTTTRPTSGSPRATCANYPLTNTVGTQHTKSRLQFTLCEALCPIWQSRH